MTVLEIASLGAILPLEEIQARFDKPLVVEQLGIDRFAEIRARDPNALLNTAFTVWQRHLQRNAEADPAGVRDHIRRRGGSFLEGAETVLGVPVVKDISLSRLSVADDALEANLVAYLVVAQVHPNSLHLADINLVNPYSPIPPGNRQYKFRKFKGLGLLRTVLARAEACAAARRCDYLTLTAAVDDLVPLFAKFGFVAENDQATSLAMEKKVGLS
jgi:hypothetical protein